MIGIASERYRGANAAVIVTVDVDAVRLAEFGCGKDDRVVGATALCPRSEHVSAGLSKKGSSADDVGTERRRDAGS
jgi:hypothetical protein